jgi:hypothetical protein
MKPRYILYPVADRKFVAQLQKAAEWLVARRILPEAVTVSDHLARLCAAAALSDSRRALLPDRTPLCRVSLHSAHANLDRRTILDGLIDHAIALRQLEQLLQPLLRSVSFNVE